MKKFNLLFFLLITITACNNNGFYDANDIYQKRINNGLASGIKYDTIFLDYTFLMDKNDFYKHSRELYNSGKLQIKDGNYFYSYKTRDDYICDEISGRLTPHFYNDTLYKLSIDFDSKNTYCSDELMIAVLAIDYTVKYKNSLQKPSLLNPEISDYFYVKGNLAIEIFLTVYGPRVCYIDKCRERIMDGEKRSKKKLKQEKTISDI